jgi:hypothetical protein
MAEIIFHFDGAFNHPNSGEATSEHAIFIQAGV